MKIMKKISIATLGILAIFSTDVFARTGIVDTPNGLMLRENADTASNSITVVPYKTQVEIIEDNGDWYKVKYNNQEGYLFGGYVEEITDEQENTQTPTNTASTEIGDTQANSTLKVYVIPLITSTVIKEIPANTTITIEKRITNWCYISAGEISGWVRSYGIENTVQTSVEPNTEEQPEDNQETITAENNSTTTSPEANIQEPEKNNSESSNTLQPSNSAQTEKPTEETKAFVDVDFANIRKEASTDSEIVTTLTEGTSFIVTAETEEWYKIRYTSINDEVYEGYIYKELTRK